MEQPAKARLHGIFSPPEIDRVASIRRGLRAGGLERATAMQVFSYLRPDEQLQLFPDLIFLASSAHGSIGVVRDAILTLHREYLQANLEQAAEPYLNAGTYDEYRRFLELYSLIDRDATHRLAERAAAHSDPDIREAGDDFLERLHAPSDGLKKRAPRMKLWRLTLQSCRLSFSPPE